MPAGERIGGGYIDVEVNDRGVESDLRRIKARYKRTMAEIDRMEAEATFDADLRPLEKQVKEAEALVKHFKGLRAEATLGGDNDAFKRELAEAQAMLDSWKGKKATKELELDVHGYREVMAAEKELSAIQEARAKAQERYDAQRDATITRQAREQASIQREGMAMARAHSQAIAMDDTRTLNQLKNQQKIVKLQQQYAQVTDRIERIQQKTPLKQETRLKVDLDRREALTEMEVLKAELNRLGAHPPVGIDVDLGRSGIRNAGRKLLGALEDLPNIAVRIGPITASLKQLAVGMSVLGPTILDLTGAAGALIGVLGTGLTGALSVGSAGLIGFSGAALGVFASVKQVTNQVKIAKQATDAYSKAVLQYGENSTQAKDAQNKMNSVLKGVPRNARVAAHAMTDLSAAWTKATGPTQGSIGHVLTDGLRTAMNMMPAFAKRTNEFSGMLEGGFRSAFDYLRHGGGDAINFIQKEFNQATPNLLRAMGGFGQGFINVAQSASRYLPELTRGIDHIAESFRNFTSGSNFDSVMDRWVTHARDLVRFFSEATKVLVHFFGAGADSGDRMVNTMTNALTRWDQFLTSTRGRNDMAKFFDNAVAGAQGLYAALAPLIQSFVMWSASLSPIFTGFLKGIGYVSQFVAEVTKLTGLAGPLGTLGVTLGSLWAIGKIGSATSRVMALGGALRGVAASRGPLAALGQLLKGNISMNASMAEGGTVAGAAIASEMEAAGTVVAAEIGAAMRGGGAVAAGEVAAAETAGGAGAARAAAAGGLGAGATRAGMLGGVGSAALLGGIGLYIDNQLNRRNDEFARKGGIEGALGKASNVGEWLARNIPVTKPTVGLADSIFGRTVQAHGKVDTRGFGSQFFGINPDQLNKLADAQTNLATQVNYTRDAHIRLERAQRSVNTLEEHGKRGTDEYRAALAELSTATTDYNQQLALRRQLAQQTQNQTRQLTQDSKEEVSGLAAEISKYKESMNAERKAGASKEVMARMNEHLAELQGRLAGAQDRLNNRTTQAVFANTNYARALKGMPPIARAAATAFESLSKSLGARTATTIATKFADPSAAAKVIKTADEASRAGAGRKVVIDIVANSRSAEDALKRLRGARVEPKLFNIVERGGDAAVRKLERIVGIKLTPKQQKIIENGGEHALALLDEIAAKQLRNKVFRVRLQDEASARLDHIMASLNAIPNQKDIVVNTTYQERRAYREGPAAHPRGRMGGSPQRGVGPGFASGGHVMRPTYLAGEEAPQFPEWVIATNPRYRKNNLEYWKQAGQDLGIPGFAGGGLNQVFPTTHIGQGGKRLSAMQIRAIFEQAGFTPRQALWFAGVTQRESTRRPGMMQIDPGDGNIGMGLTQITPGRNGANWGGPGSATYKKFLSLGGASAMRNPFVNAQMAKFMFDQSGMQPWASSSNGIPMPTGSVSSVKGKVNLGKGAGVKMVPGFQKALDWATKQIGRMPDQGSRNVGSRVDALQKKFGMNAAQWCAMFVSEALVKAGMPKSLYKGGAAVQNLREWARAGTHGFVKGLIDVTKARPGDVVTFGNAHTGIIEKVNARRHTISTIEGNTSDPGGVARRSHSFSTVGMSIERPNYPRVKASGAGGGTKETIVAGRSILLPNEVAQRIEAKMGAMGADEDDTVKYTNEYIGLQIQQVQNNKRMIKDARDRIKVLNSRIANPQTVTQRQKSVQERSTLFGSIQSLGAQNRSTTQGIQQSLLERQFGVGGLTMNEAMTAAFSPTDVNATSQNAQSGLAAWTAIWERIKNDPKVSRSRKLAVLGQIAQYRGQVDQFSADTDTGRANMAGLYQANQTKALNPMMNSFNNAVISTPMDFSDDMSTIQPVVSWWQNEYKMAMESGVQENIDWAVQGLTQAQSQMEGVAAQMRDASHAVFDTGLAQAGLTPYNLNDDLAAVNNLVAYWAGQYQTDLASGVQANIQQSAQMLAQYQAQAVQITKQLQEQPLQAQYALAQLSDTMDDDTAALKSLLSLHEQWLAQAQAINDFGGIIEEAGTVKQLRDQLKNIQDTLAQQVGDFNAARLNLFRTMGSNYGAAPGGQNISIDLSPRFSAMPEDPHAWANALAFELRAAL